MEAQMPASDYDQMVDFASHPTETEPTVAGLARLAGPEARVLELGVGTGRLALPLAPLVGEMHGVELDQSMADAMRAKPGAEQVRLHMRLDFAPAGWTLVGYKILRPDGAVLAMTDGGEADARRITVALHAGPYEPIVPARMEDRGPVTAVMVADRTGEIMEGQRGWFLQVPLGGRGYVTLQAPKDLTREQVVQMAAGVSRN